MVWNGGEPLYTASGGRGEAGLTKWLVKLAEGSAQCRLTSFNLRSRANLAASRWAAFLASSSSLSFSSCASNWSRQQQNETNTKTQKNYRTEKTMQMKNKPKKKGNEKKKVSNVTN